MYRNEYLISFVRYGIENICTPTNIRPQKFTGFSIIKKIARQYSFYLLYCFRTNSINEEMKFYYFSMGHRAGFTDHFLKQLVIRSAFYDFQIEALTYCLFSRE